MKHHTVFSDGSMCGFVLGILSAVVYVWKLNEDSVFYSGGPAWLQVVFYPGLFTGHFLYDHGVKEVALCVIAGIAVMGAVGMVVGWAATFLVHGLTGKKHDA